MNLEQKKQPISITASLVAESNRLDFLPFYFGARLMSRGEELIYRWMDALSEDYDGGYWNFYTVSNGGFYMSPAYDKEMRVTVAGNDFSGELSADAAGIVATLFTLNQLAQVSEDEGIINLYYLLRDFAMCHPENVNIFRAID